MQQTAIRQAKQQDLEEIVALVKNTIKTIYPRYYPEGAVDFFLKHHEMDRVKSDLLAGIVYVFTVDHKILGTVTIKNNEIARLFVEPEMQGKGFGSRLIDFAEERIWKSYEEICLDASFPAKQIYLNRGYREREYHKILTENGDYLCYDQMVKTIGRSRDMEKVIKVGIGIMLISQGKILLGHRVVNAEDTGGIYEPDSWCLPGGKQEYEETILEGAIREFKEETNLEIDELEIFNVADDIQPDRHFVTIQVIARNFKGELKVMEPEKQDEWRWFPLDKLPESLYSPSEKFIRTYLNRI